MQVVLGTRAKTNLDYDVSELPDPFVVPPPPRPILALPDESMVIPSGYISELHLPELTVPSFYSNFNRYLLFPYFFLQSGDMDGKSMSKRVYVGIKARQKRQPASGTEEAFTKITNGKNGGTSSGVTKSFCEAIAESVGVLRDSSGNRIKRVDGNISGIGMLLDGDYLDRTGDNASDEGGDEYEPDWRDQIYYWTGLLSHDSMNSCLLWKGSWLGSFTGKPNPDEFSWSSNAFEYLGEVINLDDLYVHGLLRPRSGRFKGYYMMDNDGSGSLEKYLDNEYYVEFEEVRGLHPPRYTVVGKGDSNFGTFVLTGTYNAGNRVLEMARQYICEEDERCAMNVNQLKMHLIAAAAAMS